MSLHPYMGFCGDPGEGAVLVFAHDVRQARPLAYCALNGWTEVDYIDVRVRRLRKHVDHLRSLADPQKLAADFAHVIDAPGSCPNCERWGSPSVPGGCAGCAEGTTP